jgi:hypothetical protein
VAPPVLQTTGIRAKSLQGRLPSDGPAQGERQLSKIGATQEQPEHGASDFGCVPTTVIYRTHRNGIGFMRIKALPDTENAVDIGAYSQHWRGRAAKATLINSKVHL